MRKLSIDEIESVEEEKGIKLAKIEIDGLNETGSNQYHILVKKCKFKPDSKHKNESASDGYSLCYEVALLNIVIDVEFLEEVKFFTQCTESELFIHVGNYMGTVYMMNTLSDRYYLKDFDSSIEE